tara:strand:+ start:23 stop:709 length:687 start_codon:yes stop_codon:yes gene_type:complete
MTKYLLLYLSFLTSINLTAQNRTIVIQIDTIESFNSNISTLSTYVTNQGFLNMGEEFDSTQTFDLNSFPNYINTITIQTDSSNLQLSIGNGSYLEFLNIYSLKSDTLRIKKFEQYYTKTVDTTYTIIEYYKMINGNLDKKPFKIKKKKSFSSKEQEIIPPKQIIINVNGQDYIINMFKASSQGYEVTHGHGYKPRKHLDKKGDYKKRLTYFYINSENNNLIWKGIIKL